MVPSRRPASLLRRNHCERSGLAAFVAGLGGLGRRPRPRGRRRFLQGRVEPTRRGVPELG